MKIGDLHELPGHLFRRTHQISVALFSANLSRQDITSIQFAVLVAISSYNPIDATRLSEVISLDRATLVGVLDRLEAKALVQRVPSELDRRVKLLTLTSAGEAAIKGVEGQVIKTQTEIVAPLDPEERAELIRLLKKLVRRHRTKEHLG